MTMLKGKTNILTLLPILFSCSLHAQAEQDILQSILSKLADYTSRYPREEIFVHTDKDEYIAGEDLWFKVYLADRKSFRSSPYSSIAYLEVLNIENKPVLRKMVHLADGAGPGHMILPDSLKTGFYTLRAYTNLMKNSLPYNCFSKEITIYNTLKNESTHVIRNSNSPLLSRPDIQPGTGAMIRINNSRADSIEFFLGNDNYQGDTVIKYLVIQSRANADFSGTIQTGKSRIAVSREHIAEGISQAVVFNDKGLPIASRYFYVPVRDIEEPGIQVNESYSSREKINIGFAPRSFMKISGSTSISVSPFTGNYSPGIDAYLVFGSEFNTASGYFNDNILKSLPEAGRDSVLGRLKSNWIDWNVILSGDRSAMEYLPEKDDHFIYGSVPGGNGDTVLMCSPSSRPLFRYTRADRGGNFNFSIHTYENPGDLIFITHNGSSESRPILNSSFSDKFYAYSRHDTVEIIPSHFARMAVDYQVRRLFKVTNSLNQSTVDEAVKNPRIYGKPDLEIRLSDYIGLPTMDEVFLELVPGVSLRPGKNGYEIRMTERINDRRIELDPTLMIDGVPVKDASLIGGLDPVLVESIEITSQKYLIGDYVFNGIVNVITRAADFSSITLPEYMTRIRYAVPDTVPQFLSPDHSSVNSWSKRFPDYRNTLYWDPSFSSSASFWSCDNKMKYLISIEGLTDDGRPISLKKIFEVK